MLVRAFLPHGDMYAYPELPGKCSVGEPFFLVGMSVSRALKERAAARLNCETVFSKHNRKSDSSLCSTSYSNACKSEVCNLRCVVSEKVS